jgi:hypothetical protein
VNEWIKGVFKMVGDLSGMMIYGVEWFLLIFYNEEKIYNN